MSVLMCPHCGSSLIAPDTQTTPLRCPVCGASLSPGVSAPPSAIHEAVARDVEDDSATQAVAREQVAPLLTPMDADYQSVPSVTAMPSSQSVEDGTTQISSPPTRVAPRAAADEAPERTQELPRSALPPEPRRPARVLRALSVALVALVLLAVVVVAALAANGVFNGASPHPVSTATVALPTPTATPTFSLRGFYHVAYPTGWFVQQRNTAPQSYSALFAATNGNVASVNIVVEQNVNIAAPDALDEQFIRKFAQAGIPLKVSEPTTVTVAGQPWTQRAADVMLVVAPEQPAAYAHVVALSTVRGAYVYTIVELAPTSSAAAAGPAFITANQAYFQPMLASFTFEG